MTPQDYEIAIYAQSVWRLAGSSNSDEMNAVACAIRNHVLPKPGYTPTYKNFTDACEDFMSGWTLRSLPLLSDPAFVLPPRGLLCVISDIYFGRQLDSTAPQDHPGGARWFARAVSVPANHWFRASVIERPDLHPLIGTFGTMQFYE